MQVSHNEILEVSTQRRHPCLQVNLWVSQQEVVQLWDGCLKLISVSKFTEDGRQLIVDLLLTFHRVHVLDTIDSVFSIDSLVCASLFFLLAVENDFDPPVNVSVFSLVRLNNLVVIPNRSLVHFYQLVHDSLDDADSHLIV